MATTTSLFIAVPSYGGSIKELSSASSHALQMELARKNIGFQLQYLANADVVMTRNKLASYFLTQTKHSHLLFVDNDISFQAKSAFRMLNAGKPLIACVCPLRTLDIKRAIELGKTMSADAAIAQASKFNVKFPAALTVENGMAQVQAVGTGLMLVARSALENLSTHVRVDNGPRVSGFYDNGPLYGFFDCITVDGQTMTEDYSFCHRHSKTGGDVWAILDEDIGHTGEFTYRAKVIDQLNGGTRSS